MLEPEQLELGIPLTALEERARCASVLALSGVDAESDARLRAFATDGHTSAGEAAMAVLADFSRRRSTAAAVERDLSDAARTFARAHAGEDLAKRAVRFADAQHKVGVTIDVDDLIKFAAGLEPD